MARVFTEGFEIGDTLFWNASADGGGIISTNPRSGTYATETNSATGATKTFTGLSELYLRFGWRATSTDNTSYRFRFRNSTTSLVQIRVTGGGLAAYVGTTLVATGGITTLQANTWYLFEFHIKIADSGGRIEAKIDGILDIDYTGDTKPGTATTVDNIYLVDSSTGAVDDLAMNDTTGATDNSWCGDGRVIALTPNANGDSSQFVGSDGNSTDNYLLVDETPSDGDTTYVATSGVGYVDMYNLSDTGLTSKTILRVWPEARAREAVAASGTFQLGVKTGGTEYWSSTQTLLTSYARFLGTVHTTNPQTGVAWTIADLDAIQAGVKVV
jgi:hypothetical protein